MGAAETGDGHDIKSHWGSNVNAAGDDYSMLYNDSLYGRLFRLHTAEKPDGSTECQLTLDSTAVKVQQPLLSFLR